jgi:hypothetical protein
MNITIIFYIGKIVKILFVSIIMCLLNSKFCNIVIYLLFSNLQFKFSIDLSFNMVRILKDNNKILVAIDNVKM